MLEDGYEYYGSLFDELDKKVSNDIVDEVHEQPKEDDLPTIKYGHWEVMDETEPRRYGCSVCKRLSWTEDNYCSYCGAKMDETDRESEGF